MVEQCSKVYKKAANSKETDTRISSSVEKPLVRPIGYTCSTIYEFLLEAFELGSKRKAKAMGWRDIIEIHEEKKTVVKKVDGKEQNVEKTWLYYELSDYKYLTFDQLTDVMHNVGRGLVKMGLEPCSDDKLHIYASTSPKWMQSFIGAQSQGIPVVTAYDTLGESGLIHSLLQTDSRAIFTDNALLSTLINPLQKAEGIKYVIYSEKIDSNDKRQNGKIYQQAYDALNKLKEVRPDIKFYTLNDIIKMGKNAKDEIQLHLSKPDDLACIMYTSGSTSDPKGVSLTNANIVAGIGGVSETVYNVVGETDRLIAFLPLAHIFELLFELITFYWGGVLGYANVKTLTPASVKNCQGDLQAFRPTVMVGVAAVWENVMKGIMAKLNEQSRLVQKLFWTTYSTKTTMLNYHIPGGNSMGSYVFKKVRQVTGGNLRYVLNGGSPISGDTQKFISTVICPMLIGYGLTETCANACVMKPSHFKYGIAGDIAGSTQIKLIDVEDLNYFAKNNQGEILLKSAAVLKDYYKNPEETKNAITEDGWFCTGDIGEWTPEGQLKIIDRKKNLVKTANGEYIALEKLESIYRSNQYVSNICVYADQSKVKPVGIVVPNPQSTKKLAEKLGLMKSKSDELESFFKNKTLINAIFQDMLKTGKSQGLAGIEMLQGIVLFDDEWTPQNGYVTSAQKLKRRVILKTVQSDVDKLYSS